MLLYCFWSFGINGTKTFENSYAKTGAGGVRDVALIIVSLTDSINQLKSILGNQDDSAIVSDNDDTMMILPFMICRSRVAPETQNF